MYLRLMADGSVFDLNADPTERLKGKETAGKVLKMAIDLEKDSIAFYAGLKECVSPKAGKDKVESIIREEFGHIATLNEQLSALK